MTAHRRLIAIGAVAVVALALAGCDLMVATVTPQPSRYSRTPEPLPSVADETDEVPTPRPEPAGGGPDLVDAANALADLDSYRVSVVSRGLVPATTPGGTVSMTSTLVQGDRPAAEFTMSGVDGLDGGRLEAIVIGDEAWLKPGTGHWAKSPGGAADFDAAFTTLSPIDLASGFESLTTAIKAVGSGKKNGVSARHFRADSADAATAAAGLTSGTADVWLATGGGYLVSLDVAGIWDVDGDPTEVMLRIDVTRVNDRANVIRPPA